MTDSHSYPFTELLPCPFCGEKRISFNEPTKEYRYGSINCPGCLVTMPGEVRDQDELIGCWNAREPVLTGLQEDLILMSFHNEPTPQPSPVAQQPVYPEGADLFDVALRTLREEAPSLSETTREYVARTIICRARCIPDPAQAAGDASYWKEQHKVAVLKHIECCGPCRNCGAPIDEVFCGTCREMGCTLPSTQCATCHDRGYVVEDGDWEPIAIQCPTCAHSSPDKSGAA